ncbi:hypothetical protein AGLY_007231 [Aphis glycines]|uniref:Uncharacterized protein n=1 Tax=Aphis glycines TaxID=307491 RepID=A0A6G0TP57_APHGL|nr:hypothetical protein AGLY_007231 [Aphis glycines]
MRPSTMAVLRCVVLLLWCCSGFAVSMSNDQNTTRGVDEFLTSLTQMIGTVLNTDARYSGIFGDGSQSVSGRPNRPPAADYFETGRPPFLNRPPVGRPYPPPYPENGGPYPAPYLENGGPYPPPYPDNGGSYPPPFRPYGYRPGPGAAAVDYLQQNSIVQALSSISQHDDLRCVPRLLCEVSSGTRPGYNQQYGYYQQQQQQQSSIPFLSKDALITLLTVLNFVDDSPLLMFGRAALLGYNARGDPRYCTTAYPTCPRDPDQLINYLNNHNGGFFRFFNQQLPQYAPQYASHQQPPYPQRPPYPDQPPYPQRPLYPLYSQRPPFLQQRPPYVGQQQNYAPQYQRPQQHFGNGYKSRVDDQQNPRILSGSPDQYYDVPSVYDLQLDRPRPTPMKFPSAIDNGGASNSISHFAFPSDHNGAGGGNRQAKKIKMIFPDRTGTGGLRADLDKYGNYKGVYYAEGAIKFVDDGTSNGGRPSTIRLPQQRPVDDFSVLGNRLPYERRPKFQFPRTSE